jgi:hypothetical protein
VRRGIAGAAIVGLLLVGCGARSIGDVNGSFHLPGLPAADLQRAGLNFSRGTHGSGHGETVRVGADGRFTVKLAAGSYSVLGALSGTPGGPPPETCGAEKRVVVTAHHTTRFDYVCRAKPVDANPSH